MVSELTAAELKVKIADAELALEQLDLGKSVAQIRDGDGWAEFNQSRRPQLLQRISDLKDELRHRETGQPRRGPIYLTAGCA